MSDLYDADILLWSEHQTELLRRLAAGERLNERPDWTNIIEEVESVGRSQLTAVESLVVQALLHELKVLAWPQAREVPHWRAEAIGFRDDARRSFAPSMRQRIDMAALYRQALRRLPAELDGVPALGLPQAGPASIDVFLSRD